MLLDYFKGHMGGNTIVLIMGEQVPPGLEMTVAQKILTSTYLASHEVGLLYPPRQGGHLMVKIVEPDNQDFIIACGGLTQVLGKALMETQLGEYFGIEAKEPLTKVLLETDAGMLELFIGVQGGRATKVTSDLTLFAQDCYNMGVYPMDINGVEVMRVGKFLVVDGEKLHRRHPDLDYAALDEGSRDVLLALHKEFHLLTGKEYHDYSLHDSLSRSQACLRAVFPHNLQEGWVEPACGTGTVAIGIALYEGGEAPLQGTFKTCFETGGGESLGGPDLSELELRYEGGRPQVAYFSHSFIEIVSWGQVRL